MCSTLGRAQVSTSYILVPFCGKSQKQRRMCLLLNCVWHFTQAPAFWKPQTYCYAHCKFKCKSHWSYNFLFIINIIIIFKYVYTLCLLCLVSPRSCSRLWTNWLLSAPSTSCCQRTAAGRGRRLSRLWAAGSERNWTINKTKRIPLPPRLATSLHFPPLPSLCLCLPHQTKSSEQC